MTEPQKLRIAIIGAGIAGLAAAIGLQKHTGIDVQIFERATELCEIGASIALGPNGMRTLERLGVFEALGDDLAFRNESGHPMIYRHWKTNEIDSFDNHRGQVSYLHRSSRFYRAHLQQALLAHVDPGRLHLGKSFSSISSSPKSDEINFSFTDGSSITADVLLATDGINSAVRRFFIPNSIPKWTGWTAFRTVFPVSLVSHIQPSVLKEAYHWWGPTTTFFSSKLGKDLFTIVGSYHSDPNAPNALYKDSTWNSDVDVEVLKGYYRDWHPVIRDMVEAVPRGTLKAYPNTSAEKMDNWVYGDGRVTFAGDAAHAHGGAFAAGGSLALDDAWAFVSAIGYFYHPDSSSRKKLSRDDIARALKLYERTRKMHTDRVLETVHANNKKMVERIGRTIESDEELRMRMRSRGDTAWIHEHDVVEAFSRAVDERENLTDLHSRL